MALSLKALLRLPPSLRCAAISSPFIRSLEAYSSIQGHRFKSNQTKTGHRIVKKSDLPAPKIKRPPPKPKPHLQAPNAASPEAPSQAGASKGPPPNSSGASPPRPVPAYHQLLQDADQVLLYRAPKHGSYFLSCYLVGAGFILGAVLQVLPTKNVNDQTTPRLRWWVKSGVLFVGIMFSALGTVFILAPAKMIKCISLIAAKETSAASITRTPWAPKPFLKFEIKGNPLTFMLRRKNIEIDVPLRSAIINRSINPPTQLGHISIPLSEAKEFTDRYHKEPRRSISELLSAFNSAMINAWPKIQLNVRRMFVREGMAYVEISGDGRFKLDLNECQVLDEGKPLDELCIVTEASQEGGLGGWLRNIFA